MITIAKHQLMEGMLSARFIFVATLIIVLFAANGLIYSEKIVNEREEWNNLVNQTTTDLDQASENLSTLSGLYQNMMKPFSSLAFIADDGAVTMPNSLRVNSFWMTGLKRQSYTNERIPLTPNLDWSFIITTLLTLLTILTGYGAVCGEKREGTLRMVLSNPVSRLQVFLGKYFGLLSLLFITLMLGCLLSISILVINGALSLSLNIIVAIGWIFILAMLCLSLVLLFSMAISALVSRPAVSLVVLMICWSIVLVAVPGIARILTERSVTVPGPFEVQQELRRVYADIWEEAPDETMDRSNVQIRTIWLNRENSERQKVRDNYYVLKEKQFRNIGTYSALSPFSMLSDSFQKICNTGVHGYENLIDYAAIYRKRLLDFIVERDRGDSDSQHGVHYRFNQGSFSQKPVSLSLIPRWHTLWANGGLPSEEDWPALTLLIYLALNLQIAIFAFIAFRYYDPR